MLSYRHAFHAGNPADVLKHSILSIVLQHFMQKEKAFTYIDTHAGSGIYQLDDEWAQKTREAETGIISVLQSFRSQPSSIPDILKPYIDICSYMQENGNRYAGSPEIARQMSREQDSLVLTELHTSEIDLLRDTMCYDERVHIHHRNGFEALRSLPLPARTCALIDPSYEIDSDYTDVIDAVQKAYRRCSTAAFAVWYPLVTRRDFDTMQLIQSLRSLVNDPEKVMQAELYTDDDENSAAAYGLRGSGMIVINAPWKCSDYTRDVLSWICGALSAQRFVWRIL